MKSLKIDALTRPLLSAIIAIIAVLSMFVVTVSLRAADSTFGYTSQGGSLAVLCGSGGDSQIAVKGTSISGELVSVSAYIRSQSGTGNFNYSLALYSDNAGVPGSALVSSPTRTFSASASPTLVTENLSYSMDGSNYWVVISGIKTTLDNCRLMYDTGGVSGDGAVNDVSWVTDDNRYSIYATYTASGGGTDTHTATTIESGSVKINSGSLKIQ